MAIPMKVWKSRTKRRLDITPKKYGICSDPRICIDRCSFTLHSETLLKKIMGDKRVFKKEIFEKWKKYVVQMYDDKGATHGLHFPLKKFEGEEIAWIKISLREPHIAKTYVNFLKWYRMENNVPKPDYGFFDTNFLPLHMNDNEKILRKFCILYSEITWGLKKSYLNILKKLELCPEDTLLEDITLNADSIEVPVEFLHRDIAEYEYLTDKAKGTTIVKYNDFTRTTYINKKLKNYKSQLKFYQKAPGIARMELTFHKEFAKSFDENGTPGYLQGEIKRLIDVVLKDYGLSLEGIQPIKLSNDELISEFARDYNLDESLMKALIFAPSLDITFNRDNSSLRRKLVNKGLIEKDTIGRGYVRTSKLEILRLAFKQFELCSCGTIMEENPFDFELTCPKCGEIRLSGTELSKK
ncbi:hypothetical protein HNP92_001747 [Methanococcus maripaludis]|uniref:Uncharacterized protein n=1 Tax=Methanococcus maripaludis TaxID=39152 RepID=A0A7J9S6Z4_METMI|nr:hypothetical protein [Methanococcus maripaludis]MBB6402425.1 hypothetical protein [Methanococcus maripaludis]